MLRFLICCVSLGIAPASHYRRTPSISRNGGTPAASHCGRRAPTHTSSSGNLYRSAHPCSFLCRYLVCVLLSFVLGARLPAVTLILFLLTFAAGNVLIAGRIFRHDTVRAECCFLSLVLRRCFGGLLVGCHPLAPSEFQRTAANHLRQRAVGLVVQTLTSGVTSIFFAMSKKFNTFALFNIKFRVQR